MFFELTSALLLVEGEEERGATTAERVQNAKIDRGMILTLLIQGQTWLLDLGCVGQESLRDEVTSIPIIIVVLLDKI